jgi:twitching motility protein PilT
MSLLRQQLITYDEALRQATNRDDFALRVSGISATSDSKWDDFESKQGAGRPSAPPPPPAPSTSAAPSNPTPIGRIGQTAARPGAAAPRPAAAAAAAPAATTNPGTKDDFEIERF